MINPSLNELKLIEQIRNINDCENKSKEDFIKALSEIKLEILKPEIKPKTLKPKTKPETKLETKIEAKFNRKKLKKLRKNFDELKHKFF